MSNFWQSRNTDWWYGLCIMSIILVAAIVVSVLGVVGIHEAEHVNTRPKIEKIKACASLENANDRISCLKETK